MTRTIDLGLVGHDRPGTDGPDAPGPWRPRPAASPWAASRRPGWWPAAAVALVLALASGARPPAVEHAPRLTPVLTLPGGEAALTDTHLFVHRPDRPVNDGGSVTAYRLPDGVQVWRREVPTAVAVPVVAGVPLVVSVELADLAPGAAVAGAPTVTSTALDPDHGTPLWTREGGPAGEVAAGLIFFGQAGTANGDGAVMTAVDPRSGREVWRIPVDGRLDWDRDRLVSLSDGGELVTYDLATGRRLAGTGPADGAAGGQGGERPARPAGGTGYATPVILGSRVVVMDSAAGRLSAYDADTLAHLWTTTVPGADHRPRRCDELICLTSSGHIHALDPTTGQEAWPSAQAGAGSDRVPVGLPGGHLLLAETVLGSSSLIVETRTGRPVRELRGWTVSRRDAVRDDAAVPLLFRYDPNARTTWVGRLDLDSLQVAVLGPIGDNLPAWCTAADPYLLCHLQDSPGRMRLWHAG
ncbi:MAG TPA: PQQ-binding-like beta-propeller repeat protein [Natronosporangium sp.]|nr:PQQ-binding-like beta-propeller repeat protein [Natronosporangium sp.]